MTIHAEPTAMIQKDSLEHIAARRDQALALYREAHELIKHANDIATSACISQSPYTFTPDRDDMRCVKHAGYSTLEDDGYFILYTIAIDRSYLEARASSPSRHAGIYVFHSCSLLKEFQVDADKRSFFGEDAAVFGADDTISIESYTPIDFVERIIQTNYETHAVYTSYPLDEYQTSTDPKLRGYLRHYPTARGLRVSEAISLTKTTHPTVDLEDDISLPVELDENGKPRVLTIGAKLMGRRILDHSEEVHGIKYEAPGDESRGRGDRLWAFDVIEVDDFTQTSGTSRIPSPSSFLSLRGLEDATPSENFFERNTLVVPEVKLVFDRDLESREPIHLRATIELPEGGESVHTVRVIPEPIEAAWALAGNGQTPQKVRGFYVNALHQEQLGRLSIYLREDQEAFLSQEGAFEVTLTVPDFEEAPGTYSGEESSTGWVLVDIKYREQDIRCVSARSTVVLDVYEGTTNLSGSFRTGEDTICYFQDGPPVDTPPFAGTFLYKKPE